MEEGTKTKKTVFVGGVAETVDESVIIQHFSPFGDIIEVQLPSATINPHNTEEAKRHRGFAFVTYSSGADAQDAIDNMDMNEMAGKVLKVHTARPMKQPAQLGGNRAVWESEEWLQQHMEPSKDEGKRPEESGQDSEDVEMKS